MGHIPPIKVLGSVGPIFVWLLFNVFSTVVCAYFLSIIILAVAVKAVEKKSSPYPGLILLSSNTVMCCHEVYLPFTEACRANGA
jgi:hypothetical protein